MSIFEDVAIRIDRSTLQSVYTYNHKITIIGGAPPMLMPGYLPSDAMPPYHSALGHPRVHQNTETMRHSTGPPRSLCCLRRVWVPMPVPPYTITFQPSSSGTTLVSRVIIAGRVLGLTVGGDGEGISMQGESRQCRG